MDLSGLNEPSGAFDADLYGLTSDAGQAAQAAPQTQAGSHSPDTLPKGYIPMYPKNASGPQDIHWGVPADKLKDAHGMGMELAVPIQKQGDPDTTWVPLSRFKGHEQEFSQAGYAIHPTYSSLFAGETRGLMGATANTLDVGLPAIAASVEKFYGSGPEAGKPWMDLYNKHRNAFLAQKEISHEMAPGASIAGEIVGGAVPGVVAGTGVLANAALGATTGASNAALEGQSAEDVAKHAGKAGALSGALAGLMKAGGSAVEWAQGKGLLPSSTAAAERELMRGVVKPSAQEGESFEQAAHRIAGEIQSGAASPITGVERTTGQAGVNVPALAQAENLAASKGGSKAAVALAEREAANRAAMVEAVQGQSVAPETLNTALESRASDAEKAYGAANIPANVNLQALGDVMRAHSAINSDPLLAPAVARAEKLNQSLGQAYDDPDGGMQAYDILKRSLDTEIKAAKAAGDSTTAMVIGRKHDALVEALDAASPGYQQARKQFAQDSLALTQSQAMANVANRAAPEGATKVNPTALAAARRANVGKLAGRADNVKQPAEQYLSPDVKTFFDNIESEIKRQGAARAQGVPGGGSATAARQEAGMAELPTLVAARGVPLVGDLMEKILSAKHFITTLNSKPEQEAALRLFTNPEHAADVLRNLTTEQQGNVTRAVSALTQATGRTEPVEQKAEQKVLNPAIDDLRGLF